MFTTLHEQFDNLQPDPTLCATPPLSPCWIETASTDLEWNESGDIFSDQSIQSKNKAVGKAVATHDQVVAMLAEDCGHLLRIAQSTLSRASSSASSSSSSAEAPSSESCLPAQTSKKKK
jgi:hypothetical protein